MVRAGGSVIATLGVLAPLLPGVGAPLLHAQEAPSLEPGSRVRVTSPALLHRAEEGVLVERSATSLLLRPEGSAAPLELDLADVRRVEVATGSHRATLRGGFAGFWSGLILALIIFEVDESDDEIDPDCGELQCFEAPFFVAMSLGGAAVGAAVGSLFHVTEWTEVPVARLGVSAVPAGPVGVESRGSAAGVRRPGFAGLPSALELRVELTF